MQSIQPVRVQRLPPPPHRTRARLEQPQPLPQPHPLEGPPPPPLLHHAVEQSWPSMSPQTQAFERPLPAQPRAGPSYQSSSSFAQIIPPYPHLSHGPSAHILPYAQHYAVPSDPSASGTLRTTPHSQDSRPAAPPGESTSYFETETYLDAWRHYSGDGQRR